MTAFWIADRPERLASPWPAEKTAKMLVEKHNDVMLKAFGICRLGIWQAGRGKASNILSAERRWNQ